MSEMGFGRIASSVPRSGVLRLPYFTVGIFIAIFDIIIIITGCVFADYFYHSIAYQTGTDIETSMSVGMTVGIIVHGLSDQQRKASYDCDITYGTNNEFGFDYLRDNMVREVEQLRQRELNYAIVDEVDSILIDEARTPLIISAPSVTSGNAYAQFSKVVRQLKDCLLYTSPSPRDS